MISELIEPFGLLNGKESNTFNFYKLNCLDYINKILSDKSVEVIVTSPPYNVGIKYRNYNDDQPRDEYLSMIDRLGKVLKQVLSDSGSFFINIGNIPSDQWKATDVANILRKYFTLQNTIVWMKSISIKKSEIRCASVTEDFSVGHYKPVDSPRYLNNCWEYIFHFTHKGYAILDKKSVGVQYQDKSNIGRYSSEDVRDRGNVWFIPYQTIRNRAQRPHPSSFPVKLPEMCIRLHGKLNGSQIVLDPFCGIGSTAVACTKLGTSFVGFDINEEYLELALNRLKI